MMQNLTLPSSQTLALGTTLNAMGAVKNSASADKPNPVEPNTSFEMMLNRQVRAHKDAIQQKPAQQNSHKIFPRSKKFSAAQLFPKTKSPLPTAR